MSHKLVFLSVVAMLSTMPASANAEEVAMLKLHARSRKVVDSNAQGKSDKFEVVEKTVAWDPHETALVVVDMWDDHWCRGAAERVGELAKPMNRMIAEARRRAVLIVHCPSECVDFYKDSPARKRAIEAPFAQAPIKLATEQRWGTAWDYPDEPREPPMPIDDSDMGCDCEKKCEIRSAWSRQNEAIQIDEGHDAITHDGQELFNLFAERGVKNVMVCGVHLNMCVLGRPFAIRQLVKMKKNVVLVRDMTDTMYNHEMPPRVDHFAGTDLVVEHIEKYWCPSIESTDLVGGKPFRFAAAKRLVAAASK